MLRKLCLSGFALFALVVVLGGSLSAQDSNESEAKSAAPAEATKDEAAVKEETKAETPAAVEAPHKEDA